MRGSLFIQKCARNRRSDNESRALGHEHRKYTCVIPSGDGTITYPFINEIHSKFDERFVGALRTCAAALRRLP